MKTTKLVYVTLSLLILGNTAVTVSGVESQQPNIVLLLADDLGGSDLHCYGHPYSRTPNIDSLARDGTRFIQFYATGATCCPARTGLMTSKYPATYPSYPANGGFADRVTVTELLKKQGYDTGHFGKWHIGPVQKPGTYGIDSINSSDEKQGGKKKQLGEERGRDAPIYDDAIKFIEQHKGGPFYVNVWGHISHNPVNPSDRLVKPWSELTVKDSDFPPQMYDKFNAVRKAGGDVDDAMRCYLADVQSLDDNVGRLLKRLDELGLRENTIVVFNSDQGADMTKASLGGLRFNQMGFNGPVRGGKHTHWEGGVRVPWIVRWPGHVPAGRTDKTSVLSGVDWLPTLCAITGIKINANKFDGEDVSAAWLGQGPHLRAKPLLWKTSSPGSESYIREGQWKLRHPTRRNGGEVELYNIAADPAESSNVADQHPDIVKTLSAKVQTWVASLPKDYVKTKDQED
ncbi:sulfatase family protein [Rubripirellula reticaptiva]|uniref:Arylsulfatase n=1 Tax=Rubripirellula reticaptiva TaxID=2528013 RepID=A0A5C6FC68_9BACT|nr:sulfatase-like hydrolase/transferase [Rubripirellula reticaptiva]TWU58382.1 Arylsulfatase [Rubripirellula reticaptiva]